MNREKALTWIAMLVIPIVLFALSPYWNSRFSDNKKLEYLVSGKSRLNDHYVGNLTKDWPELRLTYSGKNVADPTFVRLVLTNTGDVPVRASDFEGNIVFPVDQPSEIREYRVVAVTPSSLSPKLQITSNGLELQPLLLNPGDELAVELFGTRDFGISRPKARILGIKDVSEVVKDKFSGAAVERVDDQGYGRSTQRRLLRLSPHLLALAAFTSIVLSVAGLRLAALAHKAHFRITIRTISLCVYLTGVIVISLVPDAIASGQLPRWAAYSMMLGLVATAFFAGGRIAAHILNSCAQASP